MIIGIGKVKSNLARLTLSAVGKLKEQVKVSAVNVQNNAVTAIRTPSQGRRYRRGKGFHIASQPGKAPNTDTGDLIKSIAVENAGLKAKIGTNLDYGLLLETAKNRPFLNPSLEKEKKNFKVKIEKILNEL